ncbi:BolA family protein [Psychrobacter sp. I-STPA10]|uniref:BolA family protein n=1 Tax=Psychrobacter sp. I-STPA10 TaxID=2585769 RepID=UPI002E78F103|nr:BolA/IbaG family iron-sulfur metabolism protein [Psychrobacter sp. I-STPA10]
MSMNADDLIDFLQPHFPDAFIQAANQGNKFDVRVVDASFEGKRSVQRQQSIYALVNGFIASGDIHAMNIQALTPEEWEAQQAR